MPSEDTQGDMVAGALEAVRGPMEEFHSALASAVEDIRSFLARHTSADRDPGERAAAELGAFGSGRIDAERFSTLLEAPESLEPTDLHLVERALTILSDAEAKGLELLRARVPEGGDLRETVARALSEAGRVFGVVRCIAPALDGQGPALDPETLADGHPFERWSRGERAIAPPLIVEVGGSDLRAACLAEFLDGAQKIVLVVRGAAPPAPLAPLLAPGILVVQTSDPVALARLATFAGPAAAALGSEDLVPFVHDPKLGATYSERLSVGSLPAPSDLKPLGAISTFQQTAALEHLRELAAPGASFVSSMNGLPAEASGSTAEADPVDRLAGWLLQQVDLTDAS